MPILILPNPFHRFFCIVTVTLLTACVQQPSQVAELSTGLTSPDAYTLVGPKSFLSGYAPVNDDGTVNVVVEIPTGTNDKWEVSKPDGHMEWEFKNGSPRVVHYLGYPGNYGMIPQTLLSEASGGDGDPLDVIVLGPAIERGRVVSVKLIGVLRLLDGGEQDDKLIAVSADTMLWTVEDIDALDRDYSGITRILETWFTNYKRPGELESNGFGDAQEAWQLLMEAIKGYRLAAEN